MVLRHTKDTFFMMFEHHNFYVALLTMNDISLLRANV